MYVEALRALRLFWPSSEKRSYRKVTGPAGKNVTLGICNWASEYECGVLKSPAQPVTFYSKSPSLNSGNQAPTQTPFGFGPIHRISHFCTSQFTLLNKISLCLHRGFYCMVGVPGAFSLIHTSEFRLLPRFSNRLPLHIACMPFNKRLP